MIYTLDELPAHAGELLPMGTVTLCCLAFDPNEFDAERRALHDEAARYAAAEGHHIGIYPGSVIEHCLACDVRVGVGPKQQAAQESARNHRVPYAVFCMPCGLVLQRMKADDYGDAPMVIQLGNTYERRPQ